MADMHPLRRAQLEIEQAEQAARDASGQTARDELAAAAALDELKWSATGANSEPAGGIQRGLQPVINVKPMQRSQTLKKNEIAIQKPKKIKKNGGANQTKVFGPSGTFTVAQKAQQRAMRQRGKFLRKQIKTADEAGDYALAQQSYDELISVRADVSALQAVKLKDPERIARREHKKATRKERKAAEKANGTFLTGREKHAIEHEARARADPAWAARQLQQMDINKAKKAENRATQAAVARYQEAKAMQVVRSQNEQPGHHAYGQKQHIIQHAPNTGEQLTDLMNDQEEEQTAMYDDYPSHPQYPVMALEQQNNQYEGYYREQPLTGWEHQEQQQRTWNGLRGQQLFGYDYYQAEQPVGHDYYRPQPPTRHDYFPQQQQFDFAGHGNHQASRTSVHSFQQQRPEQVAIGEKREWESRAEAVVRMIRDGTADTTSTVHALGNRLARIELEGKSSDGVHRDDDMEGLEQHPSHVPSQLAMTGRGQIHPPSLRFPLRPVTENISNLLARGNDMPTANDLEVPMAATRSFSPERPTTRFIHGDGSKTFLDPNSTAYKMMSRMGWAQGRGLGKDGAGPADLIKVSMKRDRKGLQETKSSDQATREIPSTPVASAPHPMSGPISSALPGLAPQASNGTDYTAMGPRTLLQNYSRSNAFADTVQQASNAIDLTSDEDEHHEMTRNKRMIIDLTQDEADNHFKGKSNSISAFIDLTRDDDDGNARENVSRILMDIKSPPGDIQEQHAQVDAAQQASQPTILDSLARETLELQSVAVGDEQMYFVQDIAGDASLNRAD